MKKNVLTIFFLIPVVFMSAQSLEFIHNGKSLPNGEKITITEYTSDPDLGVEMFFNAIIKNKTNNDVRLKVSKSELEIPAGSLNNFCTKYGCYSGLSSPEYIIEANDEDEVFHGAFYPTENSMAKIKYTAKVVSLGVDEVAVEVTYSYIQSGLEKVGLENMSIIQSENGIELIYSGNEDLELRMIDLTGKIVETHELKAGTKSFSFNKRPQKGIYLLSFRTKSGVQHTEKIFIK